MRVRAADADPTGRMRFDAIARFLQDVSTEDTERSEQHVGLYWVARRIVVDVERFPVYLERLQLATWCGGTGGRWAERRVSMHGDRGARVEAATLWVLVDEGGAPAKLPDDLMASLRETAGDRRVSARLQIPAPPPEADERPWLVRRTDLDLMGHVNNAVGWEMAEEDLGAVPIEPPAPLRGEIEFSDEVRAGEPLTVRAWSSPDGVRHWWLRGEGGTHVAARLGRGPALAASRWSGRTGVE